MMGIALSKMNVMTLTSAAAKRVNEIVVSSPIPVVGVRVGVKKGGCAGMSYTIDVAQNIKAGDEVIEFDGATVLIDPAAVLFLFGTEMDFVANKLSAQFVFSNPNQVSACGCGESVALEAAKGF
jgi:iron-sulfur cluster assembly protein